MNNKKDCFVIPRQPRNISGMSPNMHGAPRNNRNVDAIDVRETLKAELYSQDGTNEGQSYVSQHTNAFYSIEPTIGFSSNNGSSSSSSSSNPTNFANKTEEKVGNEDYYLYFDSLYRTGGNLSAGDIQFLIAPINNTKDIINCTAIQVGDFYFPRIMAPSGYPDYFFFRRVLMRIDSISFTDSVLGSNSRVFHFEFDVENINSVSVKLVPVSKKDTYYFKRPIQTLSDLRLIFYLPYPNTTVQIPPDSVSISSVAGSNPAQFDLAIGDATYLFGPIGLLATPVAVYIDSFLSGDATINADVNSRVGHLVTTVVSTSRIEIATLNFTTIASGITARAVIAKNRISMQLRFTCTTNQITNNILITHD